MQNFTPNDLLLHISGEMPEEDAALLHQTLLINTELYNYYLDIKNLWDKTKSFQLQPSFGFEERLFQNIFAKELC